MKIQTTLIALTSLLILTTTGCIETDPPLPDQPPGQQADEGAATPGASDRQDHPDPTAYEVESEAHEEDEAPGLEPGPITGSWKLVRVETGDQIGHFSLAQAEDDPVLDGSYAMRYGLNRYFDGVSGELLSGEVDGERAEFAFNPTPNARQRFHVELERAGDIWNGELWAELAPEQERMAVRMVPLNR